MNQLFTEERNQSIINKFISKLDVAAATTEFEEKRNTYIKYLLKRFVKQADAWQKYCEYSVEILGLEFIENIKDSEFTKDELNLIFAYAYRFLIERFLTSKYELDHVESDIQYFAVNCITSFDWGAQRHIEFTTSGMPLYIFKQMANSDAIDSFREFNKLAAEANANRENWNKEIDEKTAKIESLKETLEQYENAFNFVGLYQGFDELHSEKKEERKKLTSWLVTLGAVIGVGLISELIYIFAKLEELTKNENGVIYTIFPTLSLVLIFTYFFRVLLSNHKSVRSQIMQIELRKTLCRFIQDYSKYSQEIKKDDKDSLQKFENIIFSNILGDDGHIPSTFDGLEQITKAIKAAKS